MLRASVKHESEDGAAHEQRNDERRRLRAARQDRLGARASVEHDRGEVGAELDDERIFGIDRLGFVARPAAVGRSLERAALGGREKERRRSEPEHAYRLLDEKLDERLLRRRVRERARRAAQRLFGAPLIAEEERVEKFSTAAVQRVEREADEQRREETHIDRGPRAFEELVRPTTRERRREQQ